MYSINFTVTKKEILFKLASYWGKQLFANGTEFIKFKAKNYETVATQLCLGNISKDWSVDNMKRTYFNGYVYDSSVDYDAIAVEDILDTHKYLMKNNDTV